MAFLSLSADEKLFRNKVIAFLEDNLTDEFQAEQRNLTGIYPDPAVSRKWHKILASQGWSAPLWPKEYGGPEWSPTERFIFEVECARANAPLVNPMGTRLVGPVIIKFGTEDQKKKYLPPILSGDDYWCQGYSEPNAGSDLASIQCRADRDGDSYVINGTKIWTTHAQYANRIFMLVRTDLSRKPQEGISFLLVDMDTPGISIRPIITISGEHEVNQVFFDNVRIPAENLVGTENQGWECAKYLLRYERGAGIFSGRIRANMARARAVIASAADRGLLDFSDIEIMRRMSRVAMNIDCFEMLEFTSIQQQQVDQNTASILKLSASRLRQEVGQLVMDILGAAGVAWHPETENYSSDNEYGDMAARDYLNSRGATIYGGSSEIQLGILSKGALRD